MKHTVGAVVFKEKGGAVPMLQGAPRFELLCKFYKKCDLGRFEPVVVGVGAIRWEDVAWESARTFLKTPACQ